MWSWRPWRTAAQAEVRISTMAVNSVRSITSPEVVIVIMAIQMHADSVITLFISIKTTIWIVAVINRANIGISEAVRGRFAVTGVRNCAVAGITAKRLCCRRVI